MTTTDRRLTLALQVLFYLALTVVLVVTLIPMAPPKVANGDKVEHFAAFYGLTLLGAAAYRSWRSLAPLALALSAYGGLIELLQGLPFIERTTDFSDWIADSIGVLIAVAPIVLAAWRRRARA